MRGIHLIAALVVGVALLGGARAATAQTLWLDEPLRNWNAPGAPLPRADSDQGNLARCTQFVRPPATPFDEQLVANGWSLYTAYQAGWGATVVHAASGFDGMCRPIGYQVFVFANNAFAGTVSPVLMNARTDGSESETYLGPPDSSLGQVNARFLRYAPTDALCCPSLPAVNVRFRVDPGPLLVPIGKE